MIVYPDNNIFVSIEDDEIDINAFRKTTNKYSFVYSYAHIQELMEAKSNFDALKMKRLKTIMDLTGNFYFYPFKNQIESKIEKPENVFETLIKNAIFMNRFRQAASEFKIDREKLIGIMQIDRKRINNYKPIEVLEFINTAIHSKILIGFDKLIDLSGISLHERISALFNFLDLIGFWRDNITEVSHLVTA